MCKSIYNLIFSYYIPIAIQGYNQFIYNENIFSSINKYEYKYEKKGLIITQKMYAIIHLNIYSHIVVFLVRNTFF